MDKIDKAFEEATIPRMAFFILETEVAANGEYIPCVAKEGTKGFYRTDWTWGKDIQLARELAHHRNSAMGLTPKEAVEIIARTM